MRRTLLYRLLLRRLLLLLQLLLLPYVLLANSMRGTILYPLLLLLWL